MRRSREISRVFDDRLQRTLERGHIALLVGPRQTGKTTAMRRLADEIPTDWARLLIDLDRQSVRQQLSAPDRDALIEWVEEAIGGPFDRYEGRLFLGIDEAQKAPQVFEQVKWLHDHGEGRIQIILTGSSALDIMDRSAESLAGRAVRIQVSPFTLEEARHLLDGEEGDFEIPVFWEKLLTGEMSFGFLRSWGEERKRIRPGFERRWDRFLWTGLMPAVVAEDDPPARFDLLRSYKESYIDRDVRQLETVAKLSGFDLLLELLAAQSPGILVKGKLGKEARLHQNTVDRYLSILQQSYLVSLLRPWRPSQAASATKRPKVYFGDTGWLSQLQGLDSPKLLDVSSRRGAFTEILFLAELRKYLDQRSLPAQVHFWRTHAGAEVDFLLSSGANLIPIEVKSGNRITAGDLRHMKSLGQRINLQGREIPYRLVFYRGELAKLDDRTWAIPFWFLG